jgi:NADPH:quinone reductase-like Zn-dependent oxidoreductase
MRRTRQADSGQGEVLIQVRAASVNPHNWHFLPGTPSFIRLFTGLRQPKSLRLGVDVTGVIAATGPGAPALQAQRYADHRFDHTDNRGNSVPD